MAYSPLANGPLFAVYAKGETFDPALDFRNFMPQYSDAGMEVREEVRK